MPPSRTSALGTKVTSTKAKPPAVKRSTNAIDAIFDIPSASKAVKAKAAAGATKAETRERSTANKISSAAKVAESQTAATKGNGRAPPTTILDPSANTATTTTTGKRKREQAHAPQQKLDEEDAAFLDSRGTRKRTEDGFRVFTEDELGLTKNLTGGGTPLCPFDCDCCF